MSECEQRSGRRRSLLLLFLQGGDEPESSSCLRMFVWFPCLVLKGTYRYVLILSRGLKQKATCLFLQLVCGALLLGPSGFHIVGRYFFGGCQLHQPRRTIWGYDVTSVCRSAGGRLAYPGRLGREPKGV